MGRRGGSAPPGVVSSDLQPEPASPCQGLLGSGALALQACAVGGWNWDQINTRKTPQQQERQDHSAARGSGSAAGRNLPQRKGWWEGSPEESFSPPEGQKMSSENFGFPRRSSKYVCA